MILYEEFVQPSLLMCSGIGYMIGAWVTKLAEQWGAGADAWVWGLRVTPVLGAAAVLLIIYALEEPVRGEVEGGEHLKPTSYKSDIKYLATKWVTANKSNNMPRLHPSIMEG